MKLISKIYKMYWAFYKSTVTINLVVSLMVSLVVLMISPVLASITVFAIGYVTFGLFFSFLYKEVVRPKEYYFYYNRGISKIVFTQVPSLVFHLPYSLKRHIHPVRF